MIGRRAAARAALVGALVGVAGAGVGLVAADRWVHAPWPRVDGTATLAGLHAEVTVNRDALGIPTIHAADAHDLFFAQGFVHAQDRLWQMEFGRRVAQGRLAELLGAGVVPVDRALRTLGVARAAEADVATLDPVTAANVDAYCAGVNAFLSAPDTHLPVEFDLFGTTPEPWTPADVMAVGRTIALGLAQNATTEILRARMAQRIGREPTARLLAPYPDTAPLVLAPAVRAGPVPELPIPLGHPGAGSNAWVVSGALSASGKPVLANDTHLALGAPGVWYANVLEGGGYDVAGYSLPGAPFVAVGHNRDIAWGMTSLVADVQDLVLEQLELDTYLDEGEYKPLTLRTETIHVRGGDDVTHRVRSTEDGPLANDVFPGGDALPPFALRTVDGGNLFVALDALDRASDWDSFRAALADWGAPAVNFVYADRAGHIGYQAAGTIPVRSGTDRGGAPVAGWTDAHAWTGTVPFAELPSVLDPPVGYVVSANNKVIGDDYPYVITDDWGDPFRAERITERLSSGRGFDTAAMVDIQTDTTSTAARRLVPLLAALDGASPLERRALDEVRRWDGRFDVDSIGATVAFTWSWKLVPALVGDELGDDLTAAYAPIAPLQTDLPGLLERNDALVDDVRTPDIREDAAAISARALTDAVRWLEDTVGSDPADWAWGKLHRTRFAHAPLGESGVDLVDRIVNPPSIPVAGEGLAPNATGWDTVHPFLVTFGPSQRLIVDLADPDAAEGILPLGQSGHLFHPHRDDQLAAWAQVTLAPLRGAPRDVLVLTPESTHAAH